MMNEIQFSKRTKITYNSNSNQNKESGTYRTSIPKDLIKTIGASADDLIEWSYNLELQKITAKIIKSDETTENKPSDIDETTKKQQKTETKTIDYSTESENKLYRIEILNNPHKQLRVISTERNKQVNSGVISINKIKDKEEEVISKLKSAENDDEIKRILSKYR